MHTFSKLVTFIFLIGNMTCTSQILQSVPALLRQENQQQQLLYPVNHIAQLDLSAFSTFLKNDNIPTDTTTHHKCGTESNCAVDVIEERLCSFHKVYVKPTTGRNVYGVQRTIINQTNRTQMFSYELCGDPFLKSEVSNYDAQKPSKVNQVCNYQDSFPNSIKRTECRQQFAYRKLLALDAKQQVVVDEFQFPSHCECFLIKYPRLERFSQQPITPMVPAYRNPRPTYGVSRPAYRTSRPFTRRFYCKPCIPPFY